MIKKIPVSSVKPGMYLHDLNVDWMSHQFVHNQFMIENEGEIAKIISSGVHEIYIDTDRGLDVNDAPTAAEVRADIEIEMIKALGENLPARVSMAEEMARASKIHQQAHKVVHSVMTDVRLGQAVQMDQVKEVVDSITGSVLRNASALIGLCSIKDQDEYTFQHSVSVCTLLVTFAKNAGLDAETIRQAGIGGLLHDIGKTKVPSEIINKPAKLTDEEFTVMKSHAKEGWHAVRETPGMPPAVLDIILRHHERMDGCGYPHNMPGEEIPQLVRMASIVDVYDAITSDRAYHKGMSAPDGLRKLWEWSKFHFDPRLVTMFIRMVGIYPVGSLVKLESGRLAVVFEPNEGSPLLPRVKAIFSTKSNTYITPQEIDLARPMGKGGADKIIGHENPDKWKINIRRHLPQPI